MKETEIEIPAGCEVEKIEIQDGHVVVTFREKERKLPKTWEEFCEMFPNFAGEYFIEPEREEKIGQVVEIMNGERRTSSNAELLPDRATAEAVLALCQLIQLRNSYNGDWVPDWNDGQNKYVIWLEFNDFVRSVSSFRTGILFFKTEKLRNLFLENFRDLIEKLKPLYGTRKEAAQ